MANFIQIHALTAYPPSNVNRDDLGRPKTAKVGGYDRLRISSQCLKRSWRTSECFQSGLAGHIGKRTKRIGKEYVFDPLVKKGISEAKAKEWSQKIASVFGDVKDEEGGIVSVTSQLVHVSPEEIRSVEALVERLAVEKREPKEEELLLLREDARAVDIALFGRMLASKPLFNVEAAVQVAHAITVHGAQIEDDYFTAVDDLNKGEEDRGSGHIGELGFGSGVYYLYVCINKTELLDNLGGNEELAAKAIRALGEAILSVTPSGKRNSFGSYARAHFALAEKGTQQPRTLAAAFFKPVKGEDIIGEAKASLVKEVGKFDKVYGPCADSRNSLDVTQGEGSLQDLLSFMAK